MSDLNALFEAAQANAKLLPERPDNPTLLKAVLRTKLIRPEAH